MRMKNNMILAVCLVLLALHRTSLSRGAALSPRVSQRLSQYGNHRRPRSYGGWIANSWNETDEHRVTAPLEIGQYEIGQQLENE